MAILHVKTPNGTTQTLNLSNIVTSVVTGSSNGTISVNGSDVDVKGLGTAAYNASTAYATSGHNHDSTYLKLAALPTGVVLAYAKGATPTGYLLCDGAAVSRTTYAALFAVIGTTYGSGNGSTTFNLPNLTNKFIEGNATVGSVKAAGLPNITGNLSKNGHVTGYFEIFEGAFTPNDQSNRYSLSPSTDVYTLANGAYFDASKSNSIYGKSSTVQPPALTMRYIIKY